MSVSASVHSLLSNNSGITNLVSTRIYPVRAPQTPTYPMIRYNRASHPDDVEGTLELRTPRYQVDCYAKSYGGAEALADAVVSATRNKTVMGADEAILLIRDANRLDDAEDELDEDGVGYIYRQIVDLILTVCE